MVKEIFRIIYLIGEIHYDPIVLYFFGLRAKIMIFQENPDLSGKICFFMLQARCFARKEIYRHEKNTSGLQKMRAVLLIILEVERTRLGKI